MLLKAILFLHLGFESNLSPCWWKCITLLDIFVCIYIERERVKGSTLVTTVHSGIQVSIWPVSIVRWRWFGQSGPGEREIESCGWIWILMAQIGWSNQSSTLTILLVRLSLLLDHPPIYTICQMTTKHFPVGESSCCSSTLAYHCRMNYVECCRRWLNILWRPKVPCIMHVSEKSESLTRVLLIPM